MTQLTFCGAAGTVTGSCSLLDTGRTQFLVDCGLFQGNRTARELNERPFPFDARKIDFLLLTHAHIDHSGLVPKLVKSGFKGPIVTTPATADLLEFLLRDGAAIQESNAERLNRRRERHGKQPIEPLYTMEHAEEALRRLRPLEYERWHEPAAGVGVRYWNAGHILGSASVELRIDDPKAAHQLRLLFSGDLGPDEKAFHADPEAPGGLDYIVCESTYGGRERDDYTLAGRRAALLEELRAGLERGGNVIIPSFAVERSQELLYDISILMSTGKLQKADVYLDSPLARKATETFIKYASEFEDIDVKPDRLFRDEHFRMVESVEESKSLNQVHGGAIIISASGMCDAGRIQHHLKNNIFRPQATILFVGYQSPGTLGHYISSGSKDVRIHGKSYKVNATVRSIGNYSAHADQSELADWILERAPIAGGLFLNHGEDDARAALAELLVQRGIEREKIYAPHFDERFELVAGSPTSKGRVQERADEAALVRDWSNELAAFELELGNRLEELGSDRERQALIERLERAMHTSTTAKTP